MQTVYRQIGVCRIGCNYSSLLCYLWLCAWANLHCSRTEKILPDGSPLFLASDRLDNWFTYI
jgi:hypothetical protein